ncbi:MAG: transglycosylase SLT domain-containing protein [Xanthomonadales bacterium]|nr:transglycosylase SLT domain-containing protein [Xanthomonadales bacterium]
MGLLRALELHRLGRRGWAEAEWARAIADLGPEQRAAAARLAAAEGWHPAAIRALAAPETLGHYRLRFPLAHRRAVERAARRAGLEPALLFALARAESAFDPEAVSRAGARGLVQLLPATAEATARALGGTAGTWTRPERNLELGAWYLKSLLERHRGEPALALAAYNAGPGAVARWLARGRIGAHPDLWLETLPYRETREYVPRVLAFAMLYEWRLGGRMRPALAWLEGGAADVTLAPRCPEPSEAAR